MMRVDNLERLKELAKKDWIYWTEEEREEYKTLAKETGISIGLDGKLYRRALLEESELSK